MSGSGSDSNNEAVPAKRDEPSAGMSRRRLWTFRIAAAVLGPAVFFLLLEILLRVAGYGYDTHFFRKLDIGGESFLVQNEDFSRRFFPPETMRQPDALRMRAKKARATIRIFVLGESAAMGDPEPAFGPARYLDVLLQQRYPKQQFEIVNVSFTAINSHVLLPLARECAQHEGELWLIYMGNNEMVGPYGAATVLGAQAPPRIFARIINGIQLTRTGQLCMAVVRRLQKPAGGQGSWGGMAMFQQQRVAPESPKREVVCKNFAANLSDMLHAGTDAGAKIILNTVAVNLHDSAPFASLNDEKLSAEQRKKFDELFQHAVSAQTNREWARAEALFSQALDVDSQFAEAHFRRALCLERLGQREAARRHFELACDTDALPFRTDSRLNNIIREAAGRCGTNQVALFESPRVLAKDTPSGLCGQESFYEHVHFNFDGAYRLGLAWAQSVEETLLKSRGLQSAAPWATQEKCERRLGLTDWNRKLVAQSVLQRFNNPPLNSQFNNPERVRRLASYERRLLSDATEETLAAARVLYVEALAARPEDHHVHESLAVFLQSLGDREAALQEWRVVGRLMPHDFLPLLQIGSLLSKQGNHAEAQLNLRKALAVRPGLMEGWSELGQSLGACGQLAPALEAFEKASALRPTDPVLWAYRAKVLGNLGRLAESIECYRKAVELNPAYWEAHAALGDQYSQAGRIAEAISAYEASLRINPRYAVVELNLGALLARQGRLAEAGKCFERAVALEPDNQTAREYLRQTRERLGRVN